MFLKHIHDGVYRLDRSNPVVVIIKGMPMPTFSGRGVALGPKEKMKAEVAPALSLSDRVKSFVSAQRKVLGVANRRKFKAFSGKGRRLGGKPLHFHATVVTEPGELFFSRLVSEPLPQGVEEEFNVVRHAPVLAISKGPTANIKGKHFTGRRCKLGGRKEWELRRIRGSGFKVGRSYYVCGAGTQAPDVQVGRFYFVWGDKFAGTQSPAIRRGSGQAVEIIPAIETSPVAAGSSRAGRVQRKTVPFDPSPVVNADRPKAKPVLSLMGRQKNGEFLVSVAMTEQELMEAEGGEALLYKFYKLGL